MPDATHSEVVTDNGEANAQVEARMVAAHWKIAKSMGLLEDNGFEHDGLNSEKPQSEDS